jgi:hypothetical protein
VPGGISGALFQRFRVRRSIDDPGFSLMGLEFIELPPRSFLASVLALGGGLGLAGVCLRSYVLLIVKALREANRATNPATDVRLARRRVQG